jgi:hypothetical protein
MSAITHNKNVKGGRRPLIAEDLVANDTIVCAAASGTNIISIVNSDGKARKVSLLQSAVVKYTLDFESSSSGDIPDQTQREIVVADGTYDIAVA